MTSMNATDVRKEWSSVVDEVVRVRPAFIKRTRDQMLLSNLAIIMEVLNIYSFTADRYIEDDGSITLGLNEIDLVENGATEEDAKKKLGYAIYQYAEEYYDNFSLYSNAPNRKHHIPYVLKALIIDDEEKLGESIICQDGKI